MESWDRSSFAVHFAVKKKRSCSSCRPRNISKALDSYIFLPPSTQPVSSLSNEENRICRDGMASLDGSGGENKLKLKLKFGGVTHTIHTKPTVDVFGGGSAILKPSHYVDVPPQQKPLYQDEKGSSYCYPSYKGKGSGVQWKHISKSSSNLGKGYSSREKTSGENISVNETYMSEPVRKSKRVSKRRVLDVGFNDGDDEEDEEIRYLGKLNASNVTADYDNGGDEISKRGQGMYGDTDYMEEEEPTSDDKPESKRKKMWKGSVDLFLEGRNESIPTTRNRTFQSGKDVLSGSPNGFLEFPNGLPPVQPKKQKEKPSELEQQLKKAEAAQRRRIQSEKAAREAEAEAIRKILGQDSGRKKREEKMKKQQNELTQGKAKSHTLAPNTIRCVISPTGTIVTFSEDIGLPNLFSSVPCHYPPPREKCAGPNCTNAFKYRDSKSKLPLCSLHCYKAIHGKMQALIAC